MDKKKVKELIEQILKYCDQCYNPNWQPKSFEEFVKLGNICREAIKELSKPDWVSVEDGLPDYGESVLVCSMNESDDIWFCHRSNFPKVIVDGDGWCNYSVFRITHWQRIEKPNSKKYDKR